MTQAPFQSNYNPIADYAVLGDCHGAALVSRDGSVDWCCLERFDADPVFCRLLDAGKGGFFSICPTGEYSSARAYVGGTNILQTIFTAPSGEVAVTDFMPVGRDPKSTLHDYVSLNAPGWLVRIVECRRGSVELGVDYRPSVDFASRPARLQKTPYGLSAEGTVYLHCDLDMTIERDEARAIVRMDAQQQLWFVVSNRPLPGPIDQRLLRRLCELTTAFWQEWLGYCRYRGPYSDAVQRSALVLKLLTYAPSGAIVAAPTTSLPETIGGERNWDYRYCWPRDVTFTLFALSALGYSGEARQFAKFLRQSCQPTQPRIQIMYGIGGERELHEESLNHLEGYRGSRPVRIGNGAYSQRQIDVYGELLDWAYLYQSLGERFGAESTEYLASAAEFVAQTWREPDQGIWEMRGPPQHHVFGKIMSWVAIDRAIRMFGETDDWKQTREEIRKAVLQEGVYDGHLVQTFGGRELDASLLLAPLVGFPVDDRIVAATVDAVQHQLQQGDFVRRYLRDDDLHGQEGAFLICSFWLVDALLTLDRGEEARELYERLLGYANDVELFSEEIDPQNHELLGNFPQAFTHLGVINSAVHLQIYAERGAEGLRGTHAGRARRTVGSTAGIRGIWAALRQTGQVGRWRSSKESLLPNELWQGMLRDSE